jgi:hypothetical protein
VIRFRPSDDLAAWGIFALAFGGVIAASTAALLALAWVVSWR